MEDGIEDEMEDGIEDEIDDNAYDDVRKKTDNDNDRRLERQPTDNNRTGRMRRSPQNSADSDMSSQKSVTVNNKNRYESSQQLYDLPRKKNKAGSGVFTSSRTITSSRTKKENNTNEFMSYVKKRAKNKQNVTKRRSFSQFDPLLVDKVDAAIEVDMDRNGYKIYSREWLILTDSRSIKTLEAQGYWFTKQVMLRGLDCVLATVKAPASYDISQARSASFDVLDHEQAIDFNHIYLPQGAAINHPVLRGVYPNDFFSVATQLDIKVGIVDTDVDTSDFNLNRLPLIKRDFVDNNYPRPTEHGTAVASILTGASENYRGLIPGAQFYSASVFFQPKGKGLIATTRSLILALDWLLMEKVQVINMSLSGPPNKLLEKAISSASRQGAIIVAAVGNDGPLAPPLYPAAYDSVIAVTAVNRNNTAYRKANRGTHVDLAAPGVNIIHWTPSGRFSLSSGTSFAVPFVTAKIAYALSTGREIATQNLKLDLFNKAIDLGAKGHDPVYGHGLIKLN